jgi:hypothetical protein
MQNKITVCVISITLFTFVISAQTSTDDYSKNEFFVGLSHQRVDVGGGQSVNGFEGSYTRNVSRYFGIRGDFSFARNYETLRGTFPSPAVGSYDYKVINNRAVYNFLSGIQIKDNASTKRFKPFGYALGGVAVNRSSLKNVFCASANCPAPIPIVGITYNDKGLAGAFGGGLDIKLTKRIDLRAIQADYNPIYSNGRVNNNFRIGIGVVFH